MANNNPDYIPGPDGDFDDWQANFMTDLATFAATWNIPTGDVTDLQTPLQSNWNTTWGVVKTGNANSSQKTAKTAARKAYEPKLRTLVQSRIRRNTLITAEQLNHLGVPALDTEKTEVPPPATIPQVDWKPMKGNKMKIFFKQDVGEAGSSKRKKPEGAQLIEFVWEVVAQGGTPPTNPKQCTHHGSESRSPISVNFEPEEAGLKVYFFARWLNAKGQGGDWTDRMEFRVP